MPTMSFTVTYDGSDAELMQALGRMVAAFGNHNSQPAQSQVNTSSGWAETVAAKFAGFVFETAARGESSQKDVMEAWLKLDGVAPLTRLVKVSGVKRTHDYSGVGSSLSRNMKKSGGPKKWYDVVRDAKGERIYKIAQELIQPLKRAFTA